MSISIIILGDICPEWGFPDLFEKGIVENVFNDILPLIKKADYVVANLEAPLTSSTQKLIKNSVNLKANPSDARILADAGIKAVALANNHILDYGTQGLTDTVQILDDNGIHYYGAGRLYDASLPHIVDINGIRVGFMAFAEREFNCAIDYGIGANLWDDLDSLTAIHRAKNQCDYLVIQYHGGIEHYMYPSPVLQKKCRAMIDAGADFVTCQHSHCIGVKENWNGGEILYGQGNCIFGYSEKKGEIWNQGFLCKIEISSVSVEINYIPIVATKRGEHLADATLSKKILDKFELESQKIYDLNFIKTSWDSFCMKHAKEYLPMQFGWNTNMIRANRLLKGKLINGFVRSKEKRNAMNLIRCDAHREVVTTILERDVYNKE